MKIKFYYSSVKRKQFCFGCNFHNIFSEKATGNNDVNTDNATSERTNTVVIGSVLVKVPSIQTVPVNHEEKPKKFNGVDFKRWQQKILYYLF